MIADTLVTDDARTSAGVGAAPFVCEQISAVYKRKYIQKVADEI